MEHAERQSERGQVLVLIVLALFGLLGFTALAIDVGMIYSDRRIDQNAADAAAFGGASALSGQIGAMDHDEFACSTFVTQNIQDPTDPYDDITTGYTTDGTKALTGAIQRAAANNFTIVADNLTDDGNLNEVWLTCVEGTGIPDHLDVHVRINKPVSTSFMHLFFSGGASNTVDAVVTLNASESLGGGAAILALRETPNCTSSDVCLTVDGGAEIIVYDGEIISNSDFTVNGHSSMLKVLSSTPPNNPLPDYIKYFEDFNYNITRLPEEQITPYPPYHMSAPVHLEYDLTEELRTKCTSYAGWSDDSDVDVHTHQPGGNISVHGGHQTINPGKYKDIVVTGNGRLTLNPGLYCINSLSINSNGSPYGIYANSVTFFIDTGTVNGDGDFFIGGGTDAYLRPPDDLCFAPGGACTTLMPQPNEGLLIWSAGNETTGHIRIIGSANSDIKGGVIAPNTEIELGGNAPGSAQLIYTLQLIGLDISIHGDVILNLLYDANVFPNRDATLSLSK